MNGTVAKTSIAFFVFWNLKSAVHIRISIVKKEERNVRSGSKVVLFLSKSNTYGIIHKGFHTSNDTGVYRTFRG